MIIIIIRTFVSLSLSSIPLPFYPPSPHRNRIASFGSIESFNDKKKVKATTEERVYVKHLLYVYVSYTEIVIINDKL